MMYTERIIEFFKDNGYEIGITQRYKGGVKKECIVLKINKNINPSIVINEKEKVVDMIKQINAEVVDDVDVLSNYLYIYNNDGSWQVIK